MFRVLVSRGPSLPDFRLSLRPPFDVAHGDGSRLPEAERLLVIAGDERWCLDYVRRARSAVPQAGILVLDAAPSAEACRLLLASGADVYLPYAPWSAEPRCVALYLGALALRQVEEGSGPPVELDGATRTLRMADRRFQFGPVAFAILSHLVSRRNQWVSQAELLAVIGTSHQADCSSARWHIHQLRRALGAHRDCIVRDARSGRGYMFTPPARARP